VILFVAISRHPIIDGWSLPLSVIVVITPIIAASILAAMMLRTGAEYARTIIVGRLQRRLAVLCDDVDNRKVEQYHYAIEEVKNETGGAFRPIGRDPLVAAIAIPFGGTGGLAILEQFLK